jgi:hypothetical protein
MFEPLKNPNTGREVWQMLSCPFCGYWQLSTTVDCPGSAICCDRCGARGPHEDSNFSARMSWNMRRGTDDNGAFIEKDEE